MTEQVNEWFRQLPHDEDTPKEVEERALRDFLAGETSAEDAAQRLTSVAAESEEPEQELPRIWSFINQAAVDLPNQQEKLVDLLEAISRLPDLVRNGKPIVIYGNQQAWKDLPLLGDDIRARWNYYESGKMSTDQAALREKWVHLNAFVARITARRLMPLQHMAIWSLRDALEDEPWKRRLPGTGQQSSQTIESLDGLIPGAAQWIFHAGRLIRSSDEELGRIARGGDLFNGKPGFSKERWDFWKTRFRWAQGQQQLQPRTREAAKKAGDMMENLD